VKFQEQDIEKQARLLAHYRQSAILDPLVEAGGFVCRKMFGGLACYFGGLMVLVLVEIPGDTTWNKKDYGREIWNGILILSHREVIEALRKDLPGTEIHPVISKWLYLPLTAKSYEKTAQRLMALILNRDNRIGVIPSLRKPKTGGKKMRPK
jgi:hypothetical protein